ncbi:hypothetical protein C6496_12520 [Candidatus Poribacteria bacterium]|nr:MAG: hypothetical protein C6496_12520 [Candidatus Poribacteria bacterium]
MVVNYEALTRTSARYSQYLTWDLSNLKIRYKGGKLVKKLELNRVKEVGKKTVADFIRSEIGSVGVKNAAAIGAFAGALALSQSSSDAYISETTIVIVSGDTITVAI